MLVGHVSGLMSGVCHSAEARLCHSRNVLDHFYWMQSTSAAMMHIAAASAACVANTACSFYSPVQWK